MALRVWLPLNGSLENIGLSGTDFGTSTAFASTGKTGVQSAYSNMQKTITCSELTSATEFSLAYWLKVDSSIAITNWGDIIGLECTVGSNSAIIRDEFTNAVGLHQIIVGKDTSVGNNTYNYYGAGVSTSTAKDVWAHFTIAKNATNTYVYVNGVLTTTLTNSNFESSPQQLTGKIYLGNTSSTAAQFNDVRIYDHCLSAKEVKEIAQGLILHYKLNGISGGSGKNIALKSNNGNFGSTDELKTITFTGWDNYAQYNLNLTADEWNSLVGKKVTYTCYINNIEQTVGTGTGIMIHFRYADGTYTQYGGGKNGTSGSYFAQGESGLARLTVTVPDPTTRANPTTITHVQYSVRHNSNTGASTVEYQHAQVEIGDTPTAWSWAPEDFGIDATKITDSSGYGHDGIAVNSPQAVFDENSRYNICTQFNGSNTYINAGTAAKVKDAITIAWWGYMDSWSSYTRAISCTEGGGWNFEPSSGKLNFAMGTGASSNTYKSCTSNTTLASLSAGWHHFVGTYDGLVSNLYIDGILDKTLECYSTKTPIYYHASNSILVGAEVGGGSTPASNYFNGKLSDIRIYATALSADDILDLYHTSANVDNLQQMHAFEFSENGNATKIYKNGIWETEKIISSTEGANLFSGNKTTSWRGIAVTFDGEYLTLNGTATSALGGNAGTDFYLPITYEAGKQYSYIVSYVSGTATGSGWGIEYYPRGFSSIRINQDNYTTTQYVTHSVSTTTEESNGYSMYGWTTGTTYSNLVMKLQVIEGTYNPDGITAASVYSNKLQAVNFIEK